MLLFYLLQQNKWTKKIVKRTPLWKFVLNVIAAYCKEKYLGFSEKNFYQKLGISNANDWDGFGQAQKKTVKPDEVYQPVEGE